MFRRNKLAKILFAFSIALNLVLVAHEFVRTFTPETTFKLPKTKNSTAKAEGSKKESSDITSKQILVRDPAEEVLKEDRIRFRIADSGLPKD